MPFERRIVSFLTWNQLKTIRLDGRKLVSSFLFPCRAPVAVAIITVGGGRTISRHHVSQTILSIDSMQETQQPTTAKRSFLATQSQATTFDTTPSTLSSAGFIESLMANRDPQPHWDKIE